MTIDKNKMIKTKKKISLNKLKKILKKTLVVLKKKVIDLKNKIIAMPTYMKGILIVWSVILLVVIGLIIFCNVNNKNLKGYDLVVDEMNKSALEFIVAKELYAPSDKPIIVTLDELVVNAYYNEEVAPIPATCTGYSVIFYNSNKVVENENEKYSIESYINCKEYTSKDYNDYLIK